MRLMHGQEDGLTAVVARQMGNKMRLSVQGLRGSSYARGSLVDAAMVRSIIAQEVDAAR